MFSLHLQRNTFDFIPNVLFSILLETNNYPIEEVYEKYCDSTKENKNEVRSVLDEYFSFLINSCLNKKIAIDKSGFIKNCPSSRKIYGHITETKLIDVIDEQFSSVWKINKDQIKECKDCEFRYICTDCRAYLKDSCDIYSKPEKCKYNPYEGIWE